MCAAASRVRGELQGSRTIPRLQAVITIISILPLSSVAQAFLGDFRKGRRRFVETSRNFGELLPAPEDDIAPSCSMRWAQRPVRSAAIIVVPERADGSSTLSPGDEQSLRASTKSATGFRPVLRFGSRSPPG